MDAPDSPNQAQNPVKKKMPSGDRQQQKKALNFKKE